jgi:hypothetical protein
VSHPATDQSQDDEGNDCFVLSVAPLASTVAAFALRGPTESRPIVRSERYPDSGWSLRA